MDKITSKERRPKQSQPKNKYGYFDDAAREYVITRPDTPKPWINYLGCEDYFGLISNTAGGYSFYKDTRLRRLTRYRYNNAPLDLGGRYIYMRDEKNGDFWSPSWEPTQSELEDYSCRHGMGYSVIGSKHEGIRVDTRYFVPLGANLEIWQVTVKNNRKSPAKLSLFSAIEFCLWDAWDDATNFQRNYSIGEVEVEDGVIYHKTEYRERRNHFAYFACSEKPTGFETQRDNFLGAYRGWDRPQAVTDGKMSNSVAHGWQPMGAYQLKLNLKPGEEKQIVFVLGFFENPKSEKFDPPDSQRLNKRGVSPIIKKNLNKRHVDSAFADLGKYWNQKLGVLQVQTPNLHVNRMVNIWNAYQCMVTFNVSRSASYFESGIGRGLGFRDSNQDLLGFAHMVPVRARQRILDLAATQLPGGGAYHQYQPLTKRGNNDIGSNFNDDPLWLIIAASAYVRETGDWSILDEKAPYDNEPGSESPLLEHLERSVQYVLDRKGPHGLPLIGRADWNDCLNLNAFSDTPGQSFQTTTNKSGKTAESVFIAALFVLAMQEMQLIAPHKAVGGNGFKSHEPGFYAKQAEEMSQMVYQHAWDGEWFLRAYDDFGHEVGSHKNEEGKIYIETQGFSILAGLGLDNGYAQKALNSVEKYLATEHGIVLLNPTYSKYYVHLGEISSYPPGYKENGSVFCHNNPWVMIAETKAGNPDRAFDYYLRINPSAREKLADLHGLEPYVYAQMISGPGAAVQGEAKNSWLTGTAAWNYVAITQYILGIRPGYEGLILDPCLPSDWNGYKATREFRGATYEIEVERQGTGAKLTITLDGKEINGKLIPLAPKGAKLKVRAVLK